MPKLHELLAVQTSRQTVAKNIMDEARGAFKTGAHYTGHVRATEYFNDSNLNRSETKVVDDTVPAKLEHVQTHLAQMLDVMYNIDLANCSAKGDIVVDGKLFAAKVPVGHLMTLETRLQELRALCLTIPTHKPGIEWVPDLDQRSDGTVYKSKNPTIDPVHQKQQTFITVAEATKEHPAQVREVNKDVQVGKITRYEWTSTISPAAKSDLLARLDALLIGVKRARQRANSIKTDMKKVSEGLLKYVFTGTLPVAEGTITDEGAE